ncbi:hypothetical protein [Cohnella thailandensis]|uniref:Uncharacterized protein n=1 Tax=Cohnella thailandensis TaxID=557557 RepID=A0A841STA7_9BACL|nr:hypothetical protein [Cohnella thailandensis]MBB6633275.1 hypothetical protein [Cohnella thailandensis]MBP1975027.1 hypothetical protein [Cohnella thailandensis]
MKRRFALVLSLVLSIAFVLSACSSDSKSASEKLLDSMEKSAEIKSYGLKGSLAIQDLNLPEEVMQEEGAAGALGLLQNAELSWTGAYRADPMMVELNMKISISGDLAMSFQIPIVMTEEKMWLKVPNIPMLGLPEDIVDKFVEFDLKELAEQQGTEIPSTMDVGLLTKFANDLYAIVFKHIDEKTYLSSKSVKDAGIPSDAGVKSVVQLHVTQDQVEPLVNTIIKDIAPEVIELLASNEEYRNMLQLETGDLDEAKKSLEETTDADVKDAMTEFNSAVKSLDAVANFGIDDKGYASYTDMVVKAEIEDNGQSGSGTIKVVSQMSDINADPKFEYGEPKAEDIVPMEDLMAMFGGYMGEDLGTEFETESGL